MTKKTLEQKIPAKFQDKVSCGWVNGVKGWHIHDATPGLYTLDIEHIPNELVSAHNDLANQITIASKYRSDLCVHKCPFCFNEESIVYSQFKKDLEGKLITDDEGDPILNRILSLDDTLKVIDQAIEIAAKEGHEFKSVKFLGPGEMLMNPDLFKIIEAYAERGIKLNIFTKGALLGSDELAMKYQGMSAKELVDKLASYKNVGLLFSFQTFKDDLADALVSSKSNDGESIGLQGYSEIRDKVLEYVFSSMFYNDGMTDRVCILNAPIVPENIGESFEIYKFFVERGTPVVMTPSMLSGKGCGQVKKQNEQIGEKEWQDKLVELYAKIYAFNVKIGIQTDEQIRREGIASYVGAEPCNQVATGLYIRANGLVQMCPGRFDKETVFANVQDVMLNEIWERSSNRALGLADSHNLVNNRCPAKDNRAFAADFYERVMQRYEKLMKE